MHGSRIILKPLLAMYDLRFSETTTNCESWTSLHEFNISDFVTVCVRRSRSAERPSTSSSSSRRRSPSPSSRSSRAPPAEERKKPPVDSEKMRKLKEAYGDASTSRDYDN